MLWSIFADLGPWNWMVFGFVLLALEIVVPGFFLLWIGIAALITGVLSLWLWNAGFWVWQVQVLVFLALSLVAAYAGYRIMRQRKDDSDEPLLNRRADQLVGRTATLTEPVTEGFGRVRLDDTVWRVSGPDMPAGTRVRIVSVHGGELAIERD